MAAAILTAEGFSIIERNYAISAGEIDIVAQKGNVIHFNEVKTTYGTYNPAENFHKKKLKRFMKAVRVYCYQKGLDEERIRINLILVDMQNRVCRIVERAHGYFD